jgi:pyruvate/2-oxoglutarate/acetoin dehydrogenase E1 component
MGSEIAAIIMENIFDKLKGPVGRLNKENVPQPFSPVLETEVTITTQKVIDSVKAIISGTPIKPRGMAVSGC